jgi:hypothetical protein
MLPCRHLLADIKKWAELSSKLQASKGGVKNSLHPPFLERVESSSSPALLDPWKISMKAIHINLLVV